jgi:hypothetical protein
MISNKTSSTDHYHPFLPDDYDEGYLPDQLAQAGMAQHPSRPLSPLVLIPFSILLWIAIGIIVALTITIALAVAILNPVRHS